MRRIGQAKAELAADYTAQLSRNAGKVVFFAKHIDVMDAAERIFAKRGIGYSSIRGDQTTAGTTENIDSFVNDEDVHGRRLLADGRRRRHQPSGRPPTSCSPSCRGPPQSRRRRSTASTGSARTSRSPRGGSSPPRPIDARIAELIDSKEGLAARALDGSDVEVGSTVDLQLETLVSLLTDALANA